MSTGHRPKGKSASYRRRRSPLPTLIIIVILIVAGILLWRNLSPNSQADVPAPGEPASTPAVSQPVTPPPAETSTPAPVEPEPTEEPPVEETPVVPQKPHIDEAPWALRLVNKSHSMPEGFEINTAALSNGQLVDSRILDALNAMLKDCKAAGLSPIVCSAYRTVEKQTQLFEKKINKYMGQGLSYDEAYEIASTIVAIPGTSEHNLGLAVDICAKSYQVLDDEQANTDEQKWLMEHCTEYGFILRYPKEKQDVTGIIWEPWHYRYVGVEMAAEIAESGLCLEEYLALYYEGV